MRTRTRSASSWGSCSRHGLLHRLWADRGEVRKLEAYPRSLTLPRDTELPGLDCREAGREETAELRPDPGDPGDRDELRRRGEESESADCAEPRDETLEREPRLDCQESP